MTSDEALAIWKQSGFGKTYWTFEFAQAVERKTLDSVLSILDEYGLAKTHIVKLIRELSASPQPVAQPAQSRGDVLEKAAVLCDQLAGEFPGGAADLCAKTLRRFNEQLDKQETRQ